MQQVHTSKQARQAAELGVGALIAHGNESGGLCANISAVSLIPRVVDVLGNRLPVVAGG
jgi:nitronate monooxygenase